MANLREKFVKELAPKLQEKLGLKNRMLIPRLEKVVINMGFGIVEKDVQKNIVEDLAKLAGQKPVLCKARKSISNFKLREGMVIGAKVTLRADRMYDFVERLVNSALPRIRDFRGVPNRGFDGRGNYTLGLKEHTIFPELMDSGAQGNDVGMDITFVTTARNNQAARELLVALGMPFAGK
ncbi:MAG TPA: 50S ribosomal protein L5 [Kiritimatiellia bacterium]|nr:50S ribosomal protein L5 [Kiritimatiellia bacterium]HRU71222.1 50S ribosomal protein L5 [Kiritimatiellia bacterium]